MKSGIQTIFTIARNTFRESVRDDRKTESSEFRVGAEILKPFTVNST